MVIKLSRSASSKVVSFTDRKKEFKKAGRNDSKGCPGSSKRLNDFINLANTDVPPLHNGRDAFIARLADVSKTAAADWLKRDKPPKDTSDDDKASLYKLVCYFLKYIEGQHKPLRVMAWIRYGEEAIPDPFARLRNRAHEQALLPLAAHLVVELAAIESIPTSSFNLETTLKDTAGMLVSFGISDIESVEDAHKIVISQCIRNNLL